jgi:hypothetical protein
VTSLARRREIIVFTDGATCDATAIGRVSRGDGGPVCSYDCPQHGQAHVVPYTPGLARRLMVAADDKACCCPGGEPWSVRHGLARTRLLGWLLATLWVTNLCDLLLTLQALAVHRAIEVNRLMSYVLRAGALPASIVKLGIVSVGVVLLWWLRRRASVLPATAALTLAFVALVVYEALSLGSG